MRSCISILAAAMVVGSPALAEMIAASPGVTLTEAAQAKFNRESPGDDRHVKPVPGTSGIPAPLYSAAGIAPGEAQDWTLEQVAARKFIRDGNSQGGMLARTSETSVSLAYGMDRDYSQLARSAGLTPEEAADMSFSEIAAAKLAADH